MSPSQKTRGEEKTRSEPVERRVHFRPPAWLESQGGIQTCIQATDMCEVCCVLCSMRLAPSKDKDIVVFQPGTFHQHSLTPLTLWGHFSGSSLFFKFPKASQIRKPQRLIQKQGQCREKKKKKIVPLPKNVWKHTYMNEGFSYLTRAK